jgi:tetratricopeptide (TPR) repeat protein
MSAGLLAASAVFLRARRRRYLAVGWLWFLGTLVPVIGIVQVGSQAMADRYTYVSCIGLYVMAAWSGADLVQRASQRRHWFGTAIVLGALVAIAALGIVSRRQVAYWRDTVTLFEHSLAVAPGATFLHNNLANELRERGEAYEAMRHSLLARNVDVESVDGEILLARARLQEENPDGARLHLERALEIDPENVNAHIALGRIQRQLGNPDEAIRLFRRAVAIDPDSGAAHLALARELMHRDERSATVAEFREAVRVEPDSLLNLTLLGLGLQASGNLDEVIAFYRRAVEVAPGSAQAYVNLGNALMARGDLDEAIVFYRQAVVIAPDAAETRQPLDQALRARRARVESDQSSEVDPEAGPR